MKIMVLLPIYKAMDAPCVISLIDFQQDLWSDGHEVKMVFTNGFNAAKARKALAKFAAEEDSKEYDYVLWLDSDHIYKKDQLYKLLKRMDEEELNLLSATYKLHGDSQTAHGITENDKYRHFEDDELDTDRIIDCTVVGFGFLVLTKRYMSHLWDKYGEDLFVLDAKENCTEDVKFCNCVIDDGGRICFDPKVKVGHIELAVRY